MKISLIAAIGNNREIGLNNKLLWHIKEDFKHFKNLTMGHHLVMGRNTFESIKSPLKGRETIVLTTNPNYQHSSCHIAHSISEVIELAEKAKEDELFICGGQKVYQDFLPYAETLYLSLVNFSGEADTFFPEYENFNWTLVNERKYEAVANQLAWTFKELKKAPQSIIS